MNGKRNDVSLFLPDITDHSSGHTRKSLRRWWNQLSRLQRSLMYIALIFSGLAVIGCIIILTSSAQKKVSLENVPLGKIYNNISNPEPHKISVENIQPEVIVNIEEPQVAVDNVDIRTQPPQIDQPDAVMAPIEFKGPTNLRQQAVIDAFLHAWNGYKRFAWGKDHLKPISKAGHDWFSLGLTLVDSLDTAYIMGLTDVFNEGKEWVQKKLSFDNNKDVNLFEVTIRVLGSLLSSYHLSGDKIFLDKAINLGDRLLPAFNTPSGIPYSDINLSTRQAHAPKWSPDSSTSEVTTLQLEFRELSRASNDPKYEATASKVSEIVHGLQKNNGLVPIFINPNAGQFRTFSTITLGARGDSYYEYLLKQWIQTGKTIDYLLDDYLSAIEGIRKLLVAHTVPNHYTFVGELVSGSKELKPKMDHLTCYLPGTLALGVANGLPEWHMQLAHDLMKTCHQTYAINPTFLAPEITYFNQASGGDVDMYVKINDAHSLLRPEYLESLWYMYQLTGNTTYQDQGWQIFQAFEKYAKVNHGYTSIGNVRNTQNSKPKDMMESFFLAETLKYCYLLFSDDRYVIDLDRYVINSEAHPLPIHNS